MSAVLYGIAAIALLVSWLVDREKTRRALKIGAKSLHGLIPRILGMVALVGLVLALVPPDMLRRLFSFQGLGGYLLVAGIGALITMPAPIAFPLAGSMQKKGARLTYIVIFLGTWATIKFPMIMMESSFIGLRFVLLRLVFTIPCILLAGNLMERIVPLESLPEPATDLGHH